MVVILFAVILIPGIAAATDYGLPSAARGGEIKVLSRPSRMLLGGRAEGEVGAFIPRDATGVQMFVAHGSLRDIDTSKKGKVVAVYEPPEAFLPRIDVIAVRVMTPDGPLWGYTAIQLVGQGEAVIKTRPSVEATIKIGEENYGPVKADKQGRATIQVKVPPGTGVGIDGEDREVNLNVPPVELCAVFAADDEIEADPARSMDIFAVVFSPQGGPRADTELVLEVDNGELSGRHPIGDGAVVASYVPTSDSPGIAVVSANIEGSEAPDSTFEIVILPVTGPVAAQPEVEEVTGEPGTPGEEVGADVPWLSASLGAGFAWNLGAMKTFDVAADLHVKLPFGDHRLFVGAEINLLMTAKESVRRVSSVRTTFSSKLWTVPIGGVVGYRFVLDDRWAFPVGIHMAAVLLDSALEINPSGSPVRTEHERDYLFGIGGAAAVEFRLGTGAAFFEVRYLGILGTLDTVEGQLSTLYLDLGYRLFFP